MDDPTASASRNREVSSGPGGRREPGSTPPPLPGHVPATFRELGAVVPFTTPALRGARARRGPGTGIELLLPNPGRGAGVRVLPWEEVVTTARPRIHDRRLNQHLQWLTDVTPSAVRRVAQAVACEGLAGRAVRAAARAAILADLQATEILRDHLLAPRGGYPEDLARIAGLFAPIGVAAQTPAPLVPALVARLESMRLRLLAWAQTQPPDRDHHARMIADAAGRTIQLVAFTMRDAQAVLEAVPSLLRRFRANPGLIGGIAERSLWLLDGWEAIVLVWEDAEATERCVAALDEMAQLIPAIPHEIRDWVAASVGRSETVFYRRSVPLNEDWRSGVVAVQISRNERLRARSR